MSERFASFSRQVGDRNLRKAARAKQVLDFIKESVNFA